VVTASPVAQTICDGGTTDILLETITVASQGVRFSYDIFAQDANINLLSVGAGVLEPGESIQEQFENTSNTSVLLLLKSSHGQLTPVKT
jgi:hypothetical protein